MFISVYECYTRAYLVFLVHHFVIIRTVVLYKCSCIWLYCLALVNLHGRYKACLVFGLCHYVIF